MHSNGRYKRIRSRPHIGADELHERPGACDENEYRLTFITLHLVDPVTNYVQPQSPLGHHRRRNVVDVFETTSSREAASLAGSAGLRYAASRTRCSNLALSFPLCWSVADHRVCVSSISHIPVTYDTHCSVAPYWHPVREHRPQHSAHSASTRQSTNPRAMRPLSISPR